MTRYNCLDCPGYCCSHARIAVSDYDIAPPGAALRPDRGPRRKSASPTATASQDADEQILRHQQDHIYKSVCRFFDRDARRCTVYEARPNVCRRYPYGKACGYYDFLKFEREHQGDDEFIPSA